MRRTEDTKCTTATRERLHNRIENKMADNLAIKCPCLQAVPFDSTIYYII